MAVYRGLGDPNLRGHSPNGQRVHATARDQLARRLNNLLLTCLVV